MDIDYALEKNEAVNRYLRQAIDEPVTLDQAQEELAAIFDT